MLNGAARGPLPRPLQQAEGGSGIALRVLRQLPFALGALIWAAGALLLMANLLIQALGHAPMKLVPSLTGVTRQERQAWSLDSMLHGVTQLAYSRAIGMELPLYPWAVRARNQFSYSVLATSSVPGVAVGRGGTLFELAYAQDWCSRDIAAWQPGAVQWAASIREMQDDVERRGHVFLYVLSPSKVAQYPALLPRGYACPSTAADRAGLVPAWLGLLRRAGVHVADTVSVLSAAHQDFPFPLYPAGGTHWNAVGGALAQQAILSALDAQLPGRGLTPDRFTWRMTPHPEFPDNDLANLMNLFSRADDGPVPVIAFEAARTACRPPRITIVGGSFIQWTVLDLARRSCAVQVIGYQYWRANTIQVEDGKLTTRPGVDETRRSDDVLGADILIYEENEALLGAPQHGQALWAFLRAAAARRR